MRGGGKLSEEQIEQAVAWREQGWSYDWIANRIGGISGSGIFYQCLKHGAISPRQRRHASPTEPIVVQVPGGRVQRRFTAAEDEQLLDLARQGLPRPEIGRRLGRAHSSVAIRLLLLAAREDMPA